jgi:ABC-type molybdate transport system substrate-binding protein
MICRHAARSALHASVLALMMLVTPRAFAEQTVTVLYAGSLVALMEGSIRPAFSK